MIDTAYSLTSFPAASSTLTPQIRFMPRRTRRTPAAPAAARQAPTVVAPAAPATRVAASRSFSRSQLRYFVLGLGLLLLVVQAAAWLPLDGADLLFVRLVLFVGATVCFLASGDKAAPAVNL